MRAPCRRASSKTEGERGAERAAAADDRAAIDATRDFGRFRGRLAGDERVCGLGEIGGGGSGAESSREMWAMLCN